MIDSKPLRIGYVLKVFPRISETFILNEILELESQGIDVDIFSLKRPSDPRFHGALSRLKAEVCYLPPADSHRLWSDVQQLWRGSPPGLESLGSVFDYCLRGTGPEGLRPMLQALWIAGRAIHHGTGHLHAHFATLATRVAMLAHRLSGLDFSFTCHAKDIYHADADRQLLADALATARFSVTVTDYNARHLSDFANGSARSMIHRIYNGIPLNGIPLDANARQEEESPPSPNLIVATGRLVEKKGFRFLLGACRWLRDNGYDFRCRIIGQGPLRSDLEALAKRLRVQDVVAFEGAQCHETVLDALKRASFLVLPCVVAKDGDRDALPTVLLEAMALSKPVISTLLEGVTEIVDQGRTGILVPQRNSRRLGQAMAHLLSKPGLGKSMGSDARLRAERLFDLRRNVGQLAALFRGSPNLGRSAVRATAVTVN